MDSSWTNYTSPCLSEGSPCFDCSCLYQLEFLAVSSIIVLPKAFEGGLRPGSHNIFDRHCCITLELSFLFAVHK